MNIPVKTYCTIIILILLGSHKGLSQTTGKAENIMAAYIFNFTKFMEWPNDTIQDHFYITILGESEMSSPLKQIAGKKTVDGRTIVVSEIASIDENNYSHILFITGQNHDSIHTIIKKIMKCKTLTVSNTDGYGEIGVAVNFISSGKRIKFEINKNSLDSAGISTTSQLLGLAVKIYY